MASEIQQFFRDHGISEVEAIIPDMAGIARGKIMPAEKFAEDDGMRLPESIFLQTVTGDYPLEHRRGHEPGGDRHRAEGRSEDRAPRALGRRADRAGDSRLLLFGRPARRRWRRATCCATCSSCTRSAAGSRWSRRSWSSTWSSRIIDADYPLKPPVGRSGRAEPGRQSYSIAAVNEFDPLFDDIYQFCEDQDIEIDTLIHEDGPAQMEINLIHGYPLDLADQAFLFKRTAREAALRHKMYATFMAKPHAKEPGSAMHIHQSVVDTKTRKNIFSNPDGTPSPLFFSHIAGLQKYLPAAMALFCAEREFLSPPDALPVGADQRALGLRQPHRRPARADVRCRGAPRREPCRRRGCQSLHRDRGLAGLRLSRHGRGPAAERSDHRQRARPAVRSAALPG